MAIEAELQRRRASDGALIPWNLNDDGTDPVADEGVRSKLDELLGAIKLREYTHFQGVPDDVWDVQHDLGFLPDVDVVRSDGAQVIGFTVQHIDNDHLTITFSGAFAGMARLK